MGIFGKLTRINTRFLDRPLMTFTFIFTLLDLALAFCRIDNFEISYLSLSSIPITTTPFIYPSQAHIDPGNA
jgi:hypothetical protein